MQEVVFFIEFTLMFKAIISICMSRLIDLQVFLFVKLYFFNSFYKGEEVSAYSLTWSYANVLMALN